MSAKAWIDPNVRVRDNQTFVGFEDCEGRVAEGELIEVRWEETRCWCTGVVTEIDMEKRCVFIAVPWQLLREHPEPLMVTTPRRFSTP